MAAGMLCKYGLGSGTSVGFRPRPVLLVRGRSSSCSARRCRTSVRGLDSLRPANAATAGCAIAGGRESELSAKRGGESVRLVSRAGVVRGGLSARALYNCGSGRGNRSTGKPKRVGADGRHADDGDTLERSVSVSRSTAAAICAAAESDDPRDAGSLSSKPSEAEEEECDLDDASCRVLDGFVVLGRNEGTFGRSRPGIKPWKFSTASRTPRSNLLFQESVPAHKSNIWYTMIFDTDGTTGPCARGAGTGALCRERSIQ